MNIIHFFRKPYLSLVLSIIFLTVACSPNSNENSFGDEAVSAINSTSYAKTSNVDYDKIDYVQIGRDHNTYMEEFFQKFCNTDLSIRDAYLELDFDIENIEDQAGYFDHIKSFTLAERDSILKAELKDPVFQSYYNNITNIIHNAVDYPALVSQIDDVIINIKRNTEDLEFAVLMGYGEVSKHSAYLWFPESLGGSGMGKCYFDKINPNGNEADYIEFARTTTQSDGLGAGFGMVGWALSVGIFGGPVGVGLLVGSFVFAAVYGAVTGSV